MRDTVAVTETPQPGEQPEQPRVMPPPAPQPYYPPYPQSGPPYPPQQGQPYQQPMQQPITAGQLGRGAVWVLIIIPGIAILLPLLCCGIAAIGGELMP